MTTRVFVPGIRQFPRCGYGIGEYAAHTHTHVGFPFLDGDGHSISLNNNLGDMRSHVQVFFQVSEWPSS